MVPSPISTKTISKNLTYVIEEISGPRLIQKNLEYAVVVTFVDYDPKKYGPTDGEERRPRIVIVDGEVAIKLKGIIYTKM